MIMAVVIFVICILSIICAVYFKVYYQKKELCSLKELLINNKKKIILFSSVYLIISTGILILHIKFNYDALKSIKYLIFIFVLFLIAVIDFEQKKIPNHLVFFILIERTVFFIPEFIMYPEAIVSILITSFTGMIVSALIMLMCKFLGRGGLGAGDIKLFAVIGFMTGFQGALNIMFYSLFVASVICIFLLISKKAKTKQTVPMAPFIFCGTIIYLIFNQI